MYTRSAGVSNPSSRMSCSVFSHAASALARLSAAIAGMPSICRWI